MPVGCTLSVMGRRSLGGALSCRVRCIGSRILHTCVVPMLLVVVSAAGVLSAGGAGRCLLFLFSVFFITKTVLKKPLHFTLRTLINNYVDQSSRRIFTYSQT